MKTGYKIEKSENLAEVMISYKTKVKAIDRPKIKSSQDAYNEFLKVFNAETIEHHEECILLLVNRANSVLGWVKISQGGIAGTVIDVRVIMSIAITANASGIIIAHNHPSGQIVPSDPDKQITRQIKEAGKILQILLLDHIIIGENSYYSFSDEGEI